MTKVTVTIRQQDNPNENNADQNVKPNLKKCIDP